MANFYLFHQLKEALAAANKVEEDLKKAEEDKQRKEEEARKAKAEQVSQRFGRNFSEITPFKDFSFKPNKGTT